MPDSPFLSVEQREEWSDYFDGGSAVAVIVRQLLAHISEADRREAELREQLAAKDAEIAAIAKERDAYREDWLSELGFVEDMEDLLGVNQPYPNGSIGCELEAGIKALKQQNERLRAALKAGDLEHMNAVCDGAYYIPDETRMKIFRDGLREALAATPPAKEGK